MCKGFVKLIRNHILSFIGEDINFNEHGYICKESKSSNILESTDIINEYSMKGDNVDIIYLDFSKAFDIVSHYRLLKEKLKEL